MSGTLARGDLTPGLKTRAHLQLLEESEYGVGKRDQSSIPTDSSYQSAFMEQQRQALGCNVLYTSHCSCHNARRLFNHSRACHRIASSWRERFVYALITEQGTWHINLW